MIDGEFERESILLRAQTFLLGGRVFDGIPDDQQLQRNPDGRVKPYAVLHLGTIYALGRDRSLTGEEDQPHVMPFTIECHASTMQAARDTAGAVRNLFVGWTPSPGSEEISAPGGSSYRDRDAAGMPTLFVEAVALETTINVGSNDGYVPGPGQTDPDGGLLIASVEGIIADYLATHELAYERHIFGTPSGQWYMQHGLGRIPTVTTYDPNGVRLLTDYTATTTDVLVTWAAPQDGFVILT